MIKYLHFEISFLYYIYYLLVYIGLRRRKSCPQLFITSVRILERIFNFKFQVKKINFFLTFKLYNEIFFLWQYLDKRKKPLYLKRM